MTKVEFIRMASNAVIPSKAHPTDAGFDMVATSKMVTEDYVEYGTDIAIKLPEGHCALLFPRSSISKQDLLLCNSVGLIDENYTGEIKFRFKHPRKYQYYTFKKFLGFITDILANPITYKDYEVGDKIGQIVILPIPSVEFVEVSKLPETDRGSGGFGSSDTPKKTRKKKVE